MPLASRQPSGATAAETLYIFWANIELCFMSSRRACPDRRRHPRGGGGSRTRLLGLLSAAAGPRPGYRLEARAPPARIARMAALAPKACRRRFHGWTVVALEKPVTGERWQCFPMLRRRSSALQAHESTGPEAPKAEQAHGGDLPKAHYGEWLDAPSARSMDFLGSFLLSSPR